MYTGIRGTWKQKTGTSGTATIPPGARLLSIMCHTSNVAGGTVNIFGGGNIPVVPDPTTSWMVIKFLHGLATAGNNSATAGSQDIVFSTTDSYWVEYVLAGNG